MRSVLLVILLSALLGLFPPQGAKAAGNFSQTCARAVHAAEIANRLPRFLLHAVSLAESGRWNDEVQAQVAWPWTITAGGKGKFFPTKAQALAEIRRLQARGISNIDVGCMQLNLHYHGAAFERLEEVIEPINNVAYAAAFLKNLRQKAGSWAHAVGRYHTGRWRARGKDYWRRVRQVWTAEHQRDFEARRSARIDTQRP